MPNSRIFRHILDILAVSITCILGFIPRRVALGMGKVAGWLAGTLGCGKTVRCQENLLRAGSIDSKRGCRQAWEHLGKTIFEMMWCLGNSPDRIMKTVNVEGLDCLSRVAKKGQGILLVSGHIGNWELVSLAASQAGVPVAVVARPLRTPRLERRLIAFRRKSSIRTLLRGQSGSAVAAFRWLRGGRVLGCMMDRSSHHRRILVPFLGKGMRIPLGPAELACRLDVPVVLGCAERQADGITMVTFRRLPTDGIRNPQTIACIVGRALEKEVHTRPEQWFWIFRRQPCWECNGVRSLLDSSLFS